MDVNAEIRLFGLRRSSLGLRRFSGVMTVVIIIMGLLGNALTIAALIKCPKIRNVTVAFITRFVLICLLDVFVLSLAKRRFAWRVF